MREQPRGSTIPPWTVGDRLRKARESIGLSQEEFAAQTGISRRSISTYEGGNEVPRRLVLLAWSIRTGVSEAWLETGQGSINDGPRGGLTTDTTTCEYVDSPFRTGAFTALSAAVYLIPSAA